MTYICGKKLKYLGNGSSIREFLNYVGINIDLWEMAQICGEMT